MYVITGIPHGDEPASLLPRDAGPKIASDQATLGRVGAAANHQQRKRAAKHLLLFLLPLPSASPSSRGTPPPTLLLRSGPPTDWGVTPPTLLLLLHPSGRGITPLAHPAPLPPPGPAHGVLHPSDRTPTLSTRRAPPSSDRAHGDLVEPRLGVARCNK